MSSGIESGAGNPGAELSPPLGESLARRTVSWAMVAALAVLGLVVCVTTVAGVARMAVRPRTRPAVEAQPSVLQAAIDAYERGDWDRAAQAFANVLTRAPRHARARDYLARIELTRRDAERLAMAEEALVAGDPHAAMQLASAVAPNSPLFAQSDRVARSAREQLFGRGDIAPSPDARAHPALGLDVTVALGEALAQYEAGNFDEAAARASALAEQAQDATRHDLVRWADDVRSFALRYRALPREDDKLIDHAVGAKEAIALDERLSDGHFARALRVRVGRAFAARAEKSLYGRNLRDGCVQARKASDFADRDARVTALVARCESEAYKRVTQARAIERDHPEQALELYGEAAAIALPGSSSSRWAETALEALHAPATP